MLDNSSYNSTSNALSQLHHTVAPRQLCVVATGQKLLIFEAGSNHLSKKTLLYKYAKLGHLCPAHAKAHPLRTINDLRKHEENMALKKQSNNSDDYSIPLLTPFVEMEATKEKLSLLTTTLKEDKVVYQSRYRIQTEKINANDQKTKYLSEFSIVLFAFPNSAIDFATLVKAFNDDHINAILKPDVIPEEDLRSVLDYNFLRSTPIHHKSWTTETK